MKKVGLYFGTFNPIHIGHLAIANHMAEFTDLDEVWFVVTPRSPFKQKSSLLDNHQRLEMVYKAIEPYPKLKVTDIEFALPQPNYTIVTLAALFDKYGSTYQFSLLMGADNLKGLHKWKNYEAILADYAIYVYPRVSEGTVPKQFQNHPKIHRVDAPIMELSSTFIRKQHGLGKNIEPLVPATVFQYMDEMNFYR